MTSSSAADERLLPVNGIELCTQTFGTAADPAILLINGAAASLLWWDTELCERLAAADRYVIRYDNRDTGRSTSFPPGAPGYSFTDLAADALGILDALGINRAHVVCQSMAGGIGLILGVDHPDRLASLTFVSGSTGADDLPPPSPQLSANRPAAPDPDDPAAVVEYVVASVRAYSGGSPYFDEAATREFVRRDVARTRSVAAMLGNHYAIDFDGPKGGGFAEIQVRTLVLHGDHDPLLPPAHGAALRDAIPGARLVILPGAGHDLPRQVWETFIAALLDHTAPAK